MYPETRVDYRSIGQLSTASSFYPDPELKIQIDRLEKYITAMSTVIGGIGKLRGATEAGPWVKDKMWNLDGPDTILLSKWIPTWRHLKLEIRRF